MHDVAPAIEQVQPTVPMLGEVLELAELVKPSWPVLRKSTGPLVCEGEEEETGTTGTVPPENSDTETGSGESFPDFDLSKFPDEHRADAERYAQEVKKHFQGDYTRKTQSFAQERQEAEQAQQIIEALANPQSQADVLKHFGINLVDDSEEGEELFAGEPDPNQRIDQLEQQLAGQQQEQQAIQASEQELVYIASEIEALEKGQDEEFSAEEQQFLADIARANPAQNGAPDVKRAAQLLSGLYDQRQKAWIESKKAPRRPANGTPASKAADLTNPEERRRVMAEAADAARASQDA
jgi:hypothetical protein